MTQSPLKYSELYPPGDYEWYASDASGHVPVFTTAEVGPVPLSILAPDLRSSQLAAGVGSPLYIAGPSCLKAPLAF